MDASCGKGCEVATAGEALLVAEMDSQGQAQKLE